MGRPLNKRYFGSGAGDSIKIRAFPTGGAEGDGVIVRQKGSGRFIVTVGAVTGLCKLVDKANGSLLAGEMTITVADDAAASHRVMKLTAKKATLGASGSAASSAWTFVTAADLKLDMPEGADIAISVQPANRTGIGAGATTFAVTAASVPVETLTYQWQLQVAGAGAWTNISNGGVYSNATTATLGISSGTGLVSNKYRVLISSATGGTVTSNAGTLIS